MTREKIKVEVQSIFRDILDDESLTLNENHITRDVKGWDSLTHINIISAIEKQYKIRFSLAELDELKNVGDMIDAISKKIKT